MKRNKAYCVFHAMVDTDNSGTLDAHLSGNSYYDNKKQFEAHKILEADLHKALDKYCQAIIAADRKRA
jgi:hypothetical protein